MRESATCSPVGPARRGFGRLLQCGTGHAGAAAHVPIGSGTPASHWLAFARRWGAWAAVGVALMFVAGFVELSEEVLGMEGNCEEILGADTVVLRFVGAFAVRCSTGWRSTLRPSVLPSWSRSSPFASGRLAAR